MQPVLPLTEIVAWATLTLCTGGLLFPVFIGRVVYAMSKKDANK